MIFNIPPVTSSILSLISANIKKKNIDTSEVEVFENIVFKIAMIQHTEFPEILNPMHFIIAAEHGVNEIFDLEINTLKKLNAILDETSIIHSFNHSNLLTIKTVNAGIKTILPDTNEVINSVINLGTRNYCQTTAMELTDYEKGIENGTKLALQAFNKGSNCISFGTICNESLFSASILTAEITNIAIEECIDFNAKLSNEKQQHILEKINQAKALHSPMTLADIMCIYGGFDILTIVGGMLKAAELKMTILVDGFVPASALLFAYQLNENVIDYCIFCNQSNHKGHQIIIDYFEKKTILNLDFETNIGLGIPIALPIIKGALNWQKTTLNK